MTSGELEFYEAQAPPAPAVPPAGRPDRRSVLAAVLWLAAALLLLIAPFQDVYRLRISGAGGFVSLAAQATDGWGRIHGAGTAAGIHDTRYGVALYAIAGLLVVLAAVTLRPRRHGVWFERAVRATVVAAPALLLGVVAAGALAVGAATSRATGITLYSALDTRPPAAGYPTSVSFAIPREQLSIGAGSWLAVAALAVLVAAAVGYVVALPRPPADPIG